LLLLLLGWPLHWLFLVFTIWWFGKKGRVRSHVTQLYAQGI
jgi:hypothetical protein